MKEDNILYKMILKSIIPIIIAWVIYILFIIVYDKFELNEYFIKENYICIDKK